MPPRQGPLLALSGYLLAADASYLIATSRWGSYLGFPGRSVYVGDILFAAALITWTLGRGPAVLAGKWARSPVTWTVLGLVSWTLVRLATGHVDTVALRDAAPYLYLLCVPIAMTVPLPSRRLFVLISCAVAIHVAWLAVTLEGPGWYSQLPHLGPTRLFDLRDDYDETIAGVAIGIGIVRTMRAQTWRVRASWLALVGVSVWDVSRMTNRGGVLATLLCLAVVTASVVWETIVQAGPHRRRATYATLGLALCAAVGVGVLQSPAVQRLAFGVNTSSSGTAHQGAQAAPSSRATNPGTTPSGTPSVAPSSSGDKTHPTPGAHNSAGTATPSRTQEASRPGSAAEANPGISSAEETAGTTAARKTAWKDVLRYTTRTPARTVFGVGFGPNFLQSAGALELLSGGIPGLRAPHDILLNTWARLGLIGLLLNIALLTLGLIRAASWLRDDAAGYEVPWVLIVVALPMAALFGVVLEAPFGALPYAFALGRLYRPSGSRRRFTREALGRPWRQGAVQSPDSGRRAEVSS